MANDKLQANEIIDSKNDGGILNSDIMKALEDIDYDISQVDIDSATADDIDGDTYKELERDVEAYEADKMLVQERLTAKRGSIERQYQLGSIFRAMNLEDKMEYIKVLQSDFDEIYAEYVENYGEDNFAKKERECAEYASRYLDELIKNMASKPTEEEAEVIEAKVMERVRREAEIAARAHVCADKFEANTGKVEEDKNV